MPLSWAAFSWSAHCLSSDALFQLRFPDWTVSIHCSSSRTWHTVSALYTLVKLNGVCDLPSPNLQLSMGCGHGCVCMCTGAYVCMCVCVFMHNGFQLAFEKGPGVLVRV